jgi:glycosyltransferase involved in cell wall biosynthesis
MTQKSKPLLIHTEASHGWGGQEIRTLTECRWFRDNGFQCVLMADSDSLITKAFVEHEFEVIQVPFKKSTQASDFFKCLRVFRRMKPHLVGCHSNIDTRVALAAASAAGIPRRIRYRHVSIPVTPSPWNHLIYRKFATGIITTARSISEKLEKDFRLPAGFTETIPTGVAGTDLADRLEARQSVREMLGLPDDAIIISQVSVLRAWKGHRHLMAAFDALAVSEPRLHLVLVGGGPGLSYLPEQAAQLASHERVHLAGHREDPYPFFKAADVVVLASTDGEGVPQSTLQCFACGTPFVGTRVGGIPDIVEDEKNGILVDPENPAQLVTAISRILGDPSLAAALAVNGRQTFERLGSVERMGTRVMDFLKLDGAPQRISESYEL